jgi:hypothetical protein
MEASVVECGQQLQGVGFRVVVIDKQLGLVCCNHAPDRLHGEDGDVTMALRRLISMIGHVQIASVRSRNEPDGEELNFSFLFEELDRLGYNGFLGCEYRPRGKTSDGLIWFAPYVGKLPT